MRFAPQEIRTFFITTICAGRRRLLQSDRSRSLLLEIMQNDQAKNRYLIHEYVIMPDHLHLILTPAETVSLERAVQFIKGGYSFEAKKRFGIASIWQPSFTEHRIKDMRDYEEHRQYIHQNPVRGGYVSEAKDYRWSSAVSSGFGIAPAPEWT